MNIKNKLFYFLIELASLFKKDKKSADPPGVERVVAQCTSVYHIPYILPYIPVSASAYYLKLHRPTT